jgi:hypothetical protein
MIGRMNRPRSEESSWYNNRRLHPIVGVCQGKKGGTHHNSFSEGRTQPTAERASTDLLTVPVDRVGVVKPDRTIPGPSRRDRRCLDTGGDRQPAGCHEINPLRDQPAGRDFGSDHWRTRLRSGYSRLLRSDMFPRMSNMSGSNRRHRSARSR